VRTVFHTEIRNLQANGLRHIANMRNPQIRAALAPAIAGVVSLYDFRPQGMLVPKANYSTVVGQSVNYMWLRGTGRAFTT
jgi:hypothetical protein